MKNVVQDLTSAGIDWQREKWQSGLGSKFIHQGEKNAVKYADEVIVLSKGVQDYFKKTYDRETHFIPNGVNRPQIREAKLITDAYKIKNQSNETVMIRKEHKRELEYEKFDGYELPPRTQFSMLNKPAVSIKYGVMKFNMACIRLFEGIKYVLPILHPNKKRLALIMCPEEDSASVEWARQKDENWVNKDITSLEFVENIFRLMNWNRECRYKVLGRVANSDQGLCMLFDLEEAIMFTPKPQEYTDPLTGEMKKKQMKFFPDAYKNRIGKSYNDYIADHQMNMFEDFIGYQGSTVLDEPEREAGTTQYRFRNVKNLKIYLCQIYRDSLKTYNNRAMRLLKEECRHEFWASYEPASDNSGGKPEIERWERCYPYSWKSGLYLRFAEERSEVYCNHAVCCGASHVL